MENDESSFVRHEPCPECQSRDNLARYSDGHAYCFGCHYREPANGEVNSFTNTKENSDMITGEVEALSKRQIDFETCKFFNYQTGEYKGQPQFGNCSFYGSFGFVRSTSYKIIR